MIQGEIWLLSDPPTDAIVRHCQCWICRKYHLSEGVIATVWDHPFAATHNTALICAQKAGYTVPEWRAGTVWLEIKKAEDEDGEL